ncbi:MAG TPA: hypothetical protein VMU19_11870 [Bryobacteraceae bacterium]|nr:hypothetical protein [Bryobacteraceae bacterium]
MPLGEFTKQLAQQAILSATTKEPAPKEAPSAKASENAGAAIMGQVGAMQKALKEDEELALYFQNGSEPLRVLEIFLPAPKVAVLSGSDQAGFARVIAAVESLQLVARVVKVKPGAKPHRIALVTPKS